MAQAPYDRWVDDQERDVAAVVAHILASMVDRVENPDKRHWTLAMIQELKSVGYAARQESKAVYLACLTLERIIVAMLRDHDKKTAEQARRN